MMLEVQNGTVQTRNSTICMVGDADVEGEEIGDREADHEVSAQTIDGEFDGLAGRSAR